MRILLVALAVTASVVLPQASSAQDDRMPPRATERNIGASLVRELPTLLRVLGLVGIQSAKAAECTREGETCTSNEECCPGLECSGGPPATCMEED
jgi:hypothetical protein